MPLTRIERRAAVDFLVARSVRAAFGFGQRVGAARFDHARDIARGRQPRAEIEEHRRIVSLFISLNQANGWLRPRLESRPAS